MLLELIFLVVLLMSGGLITLAIVNKIPWFCRGSAARSFSAGILGALLFTFTLGYMVMIRDFIIPTQTEIVATINAPFAERVPEERLPVIGAIFLSTEKKYNVSDDLDYREIFVYTRKEILLKHGVWTSWGLDFSISRNYDEGLVVISDREKYDRYFEELKKEDKKILEMALEDVMNKKATEKEVQQNIEKLKNLE